MIKKLRRFWIRFKDRFFNVNSRWPEVGDTKTIDGKKHILVKWEFNGYNLHEEWEEFRKYTERVRR